MSAALELDFPAPILRDGAPVRGALDRALGHWHRGEGADALRWLRRAAREAAELHDIGRSAELSEAVTALATRLGDVEQTPRRSHVVAARRSMPRGRVPRPPPLPPEARTTPPITRGAADDAEPIPLARPVDPAPASSSLFDDDEELPTTIRQPGGCESGTRVAVFLSADHKTLEVMPLGDEEAPTGVPTATLEAASPRDAKRLAALLARIASER